MQSIVELTQTDKNLLLSSLPIIAENMDDFVVRFYSYFLKTDAGALFHSTHLEKQYKMFHSSLGVIISHIENPVFLQEHLQSIIDSHKKYGIKLIHVQEFVDSFMNALKDIYGNEFDKYEHLWHKIISNIMSYFADNL